ncbi:hypothetical protein LTR95_016377 [Oleoguttula sp. CCFEE 5521]
MLLAGRQHARTIAGRFTRSYTTSSVKPPPLPPARPFETNPPPSSPEPDAPSPSVASQIYLSAEPLDPARGYAATMRVAREGVLDKRYRPAARRVTAIICAVPVLLVTSWVLYKRQFLGEEQKRIPEVKGAEDDMEDISSTALNGQTAPAGNHEEGLKT